MAQKLPHDVSIPCSLLRAGPIQEVTDRSSERWLGNAQKEIGQPGHSLSCVLLQPKPEGWRRCPLRLRWRAVTRKVGSRWPWLGLACGGGGHELCPHRLPKRAAELLQGGATACGLADFDLLCLSWLLRPQGASSGVSLPSGGSAEPSGVRVRAEELCGG